MKRVTILVVATTSALVLLAGSSAMAAVIAIEGVVLNGAGPTRWEPVTEDIISISCPFLMDDNYVPVEDGGYAAGNDAFDGGFMVSVGNAFFDDPDEMGNEVGEQLSVGPEANGGFIVSSTARALGTSPTLRYLVKLKNPSNRDRTRLVELGSDLGSDEDTVIEGTSNGDLALTPNDRWVVTSDAPAPFSDPPVTQVFFGKQADVKVRSVVAPPGGMAEPACSVVNFRVRIPEHASRFLLFFAELHTTGVTGATDALDDAAKFDNRRLNNDMLAGIGNTVKNKIVNWDLT